MSKTLGREIQAPQVSDYEKAKHAPKLDTLLAWARVCDVDPGWLAFGDDATGRRLEVHAPPRAPEAPRAALPGFVRPTARGAKRKRAG